MFTICPVLHTFFELQENVSTGSGRVCTYLAADVEFPVALHEKFNKLIKMQVCGLNEIETRTRKRSLPRNRNVQFFTE